MHYLDGQLYQTLEIIVLVRMIYVEFRGENLEFVMIENIDDMSKRNDKRMKNTKKL